MYCYGTGNNCYPTQSPCSSTCGNNSCGSNYAIILVLFILLVIILGTRLGN